MSRLDSWRREFSAPLNVLQGELNRLLNHYRDLGPLGPGSATSEGSEADLPTWVPSIDLVETANEVLLWVDLPGVDPARVELSVTGRVLTLKGEKLAPDPVESRGQVVERPFGPFQRQVTLPSEVDVEAVQAEAQNGVLHVRLPKSVAVRPHTIPIRPA
ncbi:MAG: Hsp20/alpha crystallin family protein [Isosphaeraceae bacterium]